MKDGLQKVEGGQAVFGDASDKLPSLRKADAMPNSVHSKVAAS